MGSGKKSSWNSLVNILKGHDLKMLPQVPWFQQFCFICQVLKTANTTFTTHKEIHPRRGPEPSNHSEMLTASQSFPTAGTQKQLRFSSPMQMAKREHLCSLLGRVDMDWKSPMELPQKSPAVQQLVPNVGLLIAPVSHLLLWFLLLGFLNYHLPSDPR